MNKTEYEKDLFNRIIQSMKKHGLENCADSVFFTGSFGRGEATYEYSGDDVFLKSDVEIGVVYKSKKAALEMIKKVESEFSEEINCMTLSQHRMKHLDNFNDAFLPCKSKSLFMFDLVNCNKPIWGKDYLSNAVILPESIDPYEAKRIVANRIGELICADENDPKERKRWQAKLISAVGTAYLLINGKYVSSYYDQMRELEAFGKKADAELGQGFIDRYTKSFLYLRSGADDFEISEEELKSFVKTINNIISNADIKKPKINTFSRSMKYVLKYFARYGIHGVFGIEEKIIDSLISEFIIGSPEVKKTSEVWHNVLY